MMSLPPPHKSVDLLPVEKKTKSSSSKDAADVLPRELWETILCRLSIFSFHKLKCVCKSLKNLLSEADAAGKAPSISLGFYCLRFREDDPEDPLYWKDAVAVSDKGYFDAWNNHLHRDALPAWRFSPLLLDDKNCDRDLNLAFLPRFIEDDPYLKASPCKASFDFFLEHVCNGLLLCSTSRSCACVPVAYYVCNPLTRIWIRIYKRDGAYGVGRTLLLFDPDKSIHFKILFFTSPIIKNSEIGIEVFSSETGEWDDFTLQATTGHLLISYEQFGVERDRRCGFLPQSLFIRGIIYQMINNRALLALDIEAKRLFFFKSPRCIPEGGNMLTLDEYFWLKECDGGLQFIRNYELEIQVWMLEDLLTSTWILTRRITIPDVFPFCKEPNWWSFLYVDLELNPDEVLHLVRYCDENAAQIYSYDLRSNSLQLVRYVKDIKLQPDCLYDEKDFQYPIYHFSPSPVKFFDKIDPMLFASHLPLLFPSQYCPHQNPQYQFVSGTISDILNKKS